MKKENLFVFQGNIKPVKDVKGEILKRSKDYFIQTVSSAKADKYFEKGWSLVKNLKSGVRIKKNKSEVELYIDSVWVTFARLGFEYISNNILFNGVFSDIDDRVKFDIIAYDSESVILIKIISTDKEKTISGFKEEIEIIGNNKGKIIGATRNAIGNKLKLKIILVTKNFVISSPDKEGLKKYDISHFNEDSISYYNELRKHLGTAARYQLLGGLFPGLTIPELDNKIPAIKGEMGGHTYFSFSIEPEKLLKLGYVLHRTNANVEMMPTYQRLIKKSRLNAINDFIEEGGFFPNSLIINIDSNNRELTFDKSSLQEESSISKIGILHLPKTYQSIFIIDGQHRLYGYSNSEYRYKNTVPVVAFVGLDRREQVKLFMDINQNQKAVPRSLKNDLDATLLWDSEIPSERIKALKLAIAIKLGEDPDSPLFNRVMLGENTKTLTRCVSTESIKLGLDRSNFFPAYNKYITKQVGSFYIENNNKTQEILFPFLVGCFNFFKQELQADWDLGDGEDGYLTTNGGIESLIRLFGDIVKHLTETKKTSPLTDSIEAILKQCYPYLKVIIDHFYKMDSEQRKWLKTLYGAAGRGKYWRTLQELVHKAHPEFNPEGLEKYLKDEEKAFNAESTQIVKDIENCLKHEVKKSLMEHYKENWIKLGVPKKVYLDASTMADTKNFDVLNKEDEVEPWDCLYLIDYQKIMLHKSNWSDLFNIKYTRPGEEKSTKERKLKWIETLNEIRNKTSHSRQVKEEEYNFLCELRDWLLGEDA